jgi:hypothetical protein
MAPSRKRQASWSARQWEPPNGVPKDCDPVEGWSQAGHLRRLNGGGDRANPKSEKWRAAQGGGTTIPAMTSLRGSIRLSPTLVSTLLMALLVALPDEAADRSGFKAKRGTNISHWLSQSTNRGVERRTWFTKEDVAFLAGLGFDHLRIPIDEEQMWDQSGKPVRGIQAQRQRGPAHPPVTPLQ